MDPAAGLVVVAAAVVTIVWANQTQVFFTDNEMKQGNRDKEEEEENWLATGQVRWLQHSKFSGFSGKEKGESLKHFSDLDPLSPQDL